MAILNDVYVLTTDLTWTAGSPVVNDLAGETMFLDGSGTSSLNVGTATYDDANNDGQISAFGGVYEEVTVTSADSNFYYSEELSYIGVISTGYTVYLSDGTTLDPTQLTGDLQMRILYDDTTTPGAVYPIFFDFTDAQMQQFASLGVTVTGLSFDSNPSNISATFPSSFTESNLDASMTLTDQWLLNTNLVYDGSGPLVDQLQNTTFNVDGWTTGGDYIAESTFAYVSAQVGDASNDGRTLVQDANPDDGKPATTGDTIYIQDSETLTGQTAQVEQVIGVLGYTITLEDGTTYTDADFGQLPVRLMSDGSVYIDLFNGGLATLNGQAPIASISFSSTATQDINYTGYYAANFHDGYTPICITRGTMILTQTGEKPVEELRAGDLVQTYSSGLQAIRWIGSSRYGKGLLEQDPRRLPIRISECALGAGLPKRDLLVSRQHRMLVSSRIAERMFGEREVLIAAHQMVGLPGIEIATDATEVEYFHVLLDNHEVLYAEGAPSESLMTGVEAIKTLTQPGQGFSKGVTVEIIEKAKAEDSSFVVPARHRQRKLMQRHKGNDIAPLDGWKMPHVEQRVSA